MISSLSFGVQSALLVVSGIASVAAYSNGIGLTPAMGWNSWNHFACEIDEKLIRDTADILVSSGLAKLGYNYLNIDDCWNAETRVDGKQTHHPTRFPSGMKALGDYIHNKGLKFGLYSSAGTLLCQKKGPGSLDFEELDAKTFAEWGVDYLKYDNCNNQGRAGTIEKSYKRYDTMGKALNATGRPIYYSLCQWGQDEVWKWGGEVGNSWRTTGDIYQLYDDDKEECRTHIYGGWLCSVIKIFEKNVGLNQYAGRGKGWNDLDMLEVGVGDMGFAQDLSHFILWSALKSPLILGNDLTNMTTATKTILSATEIIAVNQDPLGVPATERARVNNTVVLAGPLEGGNTVLVVLNKEKTPMDITAMWKDISLDPKQPAQLRDLFHKQDVGVFHNGIKVTVGPRTSRMFKLTPSKAIIAQIPNADGLFPVR
ncbi:alpha-galactosidase [Phlyctochytrium arcticum]|nr:alpha-galactosidase [Phlyctochytrium arcticum]